MKRLMKKIKVTTKMNVLTGLHIGGSTEGIEIGGIDASVIKVATRKNQPYIPGSSLKGKMRSLLEQIAGAVEIGGNSEINKMFGFTKDNTSEDSKDKENIASKIIVRDAFLTQESVAMLESNENLDMVYTEMKCENAIDRLNSKANPRQIERVPSGVSFNIEFILNIWDDDEEEDFKKLLEKGLRALENDYLGGNGSRGCGQVKFIMPLKYEDIPFDNNAKEKE